jgi:hypothetical protein
VVQQGMRTVSLDPSLEGSHITDKAGFDMTLPLLAPAISALPVTLFQRRGGLGLDPSGLYAHHSHTLQDVDAAPSIEHFLSHVRSANAFRATGHQRPQAIQLQIETHAVISSDAITPSTSLKR